MKAPTIPGFDSKMQNAYARGWRAKSLGLGAERNPYTANELKHRHGWLAGHHDNRSARA